MTPQYQAISVFSTIWETYKRRRYFPTKKDWGAVNTLIEYGLQPDEYIQMVNEYLKNQRWTEYGNHAFNVFVYNINNVTPVKSEKPSKKEEKLRMIICSDCQTEHDPTTLCPKCYPDQSGKVSPKEVLESIKHLGESFKS